MAQIKFYRGLYNNYSTSTHADGIYFATDNHCIMMNGIQYGGVDNAMFEGFIKDVDVDGNVLSFKKDVKGTWTDVSIKLLEAADKSIVLGAISNDGVNDGSTIKVNVKEVGDADGLKLGDDGLYVDLTKTTKAITDEVSTARAAEKKNADAIAKLNGDASTVGSVAKAVADAVNALDVTQVGGAGKVITTVSETDGKIAATAIDLKAENVAFTPTNKVIGAVDVTGNTVTAAIASLAKSVKNTQNSAATYKVVKVTEGLATNVKEAYQLVQTINGTEKNIDVQIPVYKDQTLKSVELVEENDKKQKGQFMKYTYINANGDDTIVYVDCSKLLSESEFKNGLTVSEAGEVSVKIDENSETFLTVGEGGVKLAGVQSAINTAKNAVIGSTSDTVESDTIKGVKKALTAETSRATAAEKKNADAITKLNGDASTVGSVAKAVADAKAELLGDAAAEYNTLGKLEDKIQALDSKAEAAHTEVKEKTSGHVTVAVADSTDRTHKVVTISENDIASAKALTAEASTARAAEKKNADAITAENDRATKAEDKIESSVGLATDGSHVTTKGNYTKAATTVVGEIAALDTQVKTNADGIAENKSKISTLNGSDTVTGSVDNKIKVALTWEDVK